jgi:hypothetical protein
MEKSEATKRIMTVIRNEVELGNPLLLGLAKVKKAGNIRVTSKPLVP